MRSNIISVIISAGLFFGSLFLFTLGAGAQEIIGFDSRFYLFALEMWRDGPAWFPTTYHQPYPDYTALSTFLIYLSASMLGGLSKFTAVMPSAVAASLTVVLTYWIGALHDRDWGLCASSFLLLTIGFLKSACGIALDMYLTAMTAACCYLVYSADLAPKKCRAWWVMPLWMLGFAFRGPIGIVIPTAVVCMYYLIQKNIKRFFGFGMAAVGLLVICSSLLLWLAYQSGGQVFMQDVLRMQVLGRMGERFQPVYFYFSKGLQTYAPSFPLALIVAAGVFYYQLKKHIVQPFKPLLLFTAWMLIIVLGMSIPGEKKIRYILPAVPAFALLAAFPLTVFAKETCFVFIRRVTLILLLSLPSLLILLTAYVYVYEGGHALNFQIAYPWLFGLLIVIQLVMLVIFSLTPKGRNTSIALLAAFSFLVFNKIMVEPVELYVDRAHDFVVSVEARRLQAGAKLVFYKEHPDGMPIKYVMNMPQEDKPVFIEDEKALSNYKTKAYFVSSETYFSKLPSKLKSRFRIIGSDKLGHVSVVIFTRKNAND